MASRPPFEFNPMGSREATLRMVRYYYRTFGAFGVVAVVGMANCNQHGAWFWCLAALQLSGVGYQIWLYFDFARFADAEWQRYLAIAPTREAREAELERQHAEMEAARAERQQQEDEEERRRSGRRREARWRSEVARFTRNDPRGLSPDIPHEDEDHGGR